MKINIILGGMRLGDTIMATSGIRSIYANTKGEITWIHGHHVNPLFDFFQHTDLPIVHHISIPEATPPLDLTDVIAFTKKASVIPHPSADLVEAFSQARWQLGGGPHQIYWWASSINAPLEDVLPPRLRFKNMKFKPLNYICVQAGSTAPWKNIGNLVTFQYPLQTVTVGLKNEPLIPGSKDLRDTPLIGQALIIAQAKLFIGINSGLTQLASALQVPTIMCHKDPHWIMESGVSIQANGNIDLPDPSHTDLQQAIEQILKPTSVNDKAARAQ